MKKVYRVIKDSRKHGEVNSLVRISEVRLDGDLLVKINRKKAWFYCKPEDLVDVSWWYRTRIIELWVAFAIGILCIIEAIANHVNDGHWSATVGFAVISFCLLAVFKIENDKL